MISTLATELRKTVVDAVTREMEGVRTEVKQITTAIESSQEFLSSKFDEIVADFKDLKVENESLKHEVCMLRESNGKLTEQVNKLELNVDKINKTDIQHNAMLFGIPFTPNENTSIIVTKTTNALGLEIDADSVVSSERIFKNTKPSNPLIPIRIVFKNAEVKEAVLNRKKSIKQLQSTSIDQSLLLNGKATTVSIRDELTPLSLELIKELREVQGLFKIKYIWSGRSGTVLVKQDENSKPQIIKSREDLKRLISHYMNVSVATPSPKRKKGVDGQKQ